MLNLFQHLTIWIFAFHVGKTLKQVQGDENVIYRHSENIENKHFMRSFSSCSESIQSTHIDNSLSCKMLKQVQHDDEAMLERLVA